MKRFCKQARRFMGILLCGCLLAGTGNPSGMVARADEEETRLEAESEEAAAVVSCTSGEAGQYEVRRGDYSSGGFSGGYVFVNVVEPKDGQVPKVTATLTLTVPQAGDYDLAIATKDDQNRGIYQVQLNGESLSTVDFYNQTAAIYSHPLGRVTFSSTTATLVLTCVGANENSNRKYGLALDYITLTPASSSGEEPGEDPDPVMEPIHKMEEMYRCAYSDAGIQSDPLQYRLYVPASYDPAQSYPLLVYLNGAGSRGTDNKKQLDNLAPLINPLIDNEEYPCLIAVPQLPGDKQWVNTSWSEGSYSQENVEESDSMKMLMGMIADLQKTYSVDAGRLYLMGQSFGGYGTWDAVTRYPDKFAAAIPMCGAGDPSKASLIKDMPLMVLHGDADGSVPVAGSRDMVAALKEVGSCVTYFEYKEMDHYVQRRLFEQPELWIPWLFSQERGGESTPPDLSGIYWASPQNTFLFNGGTLPEEWSWTGNNRLDGSSLVMSTADAGTATGILNTTSGKTDGMISAFITIHSGFTGGGGLVFRYRDERNYGHVRFVSGGLELLEMVDGTSAVRTTADYDWVEGRIACLRVVLEADRIQVTVDGDVVFDTTLKSDALQGAGAAGLRYYNGQMKVDDFLFSERDSDSLSLEDFADRQVIQRDPETQSGQVTFSGRVHVEGMQRVEIAVDRFDGAGEMILDWTPAVVDVQAGTYTLTARLPQGGWYRTLVRAADASGDVLLQHTGTSRWGIGMNILCIGQSNMVGQGQAPYIQADDRVSNFINESWSHLEDPYAAGDSSLVGGGSCGGSMTSTIGNILVGAYDFPVGFIPAAQNGASLMAENNGWLKRNDSQPADRSTLYGNSLYRAQAAGGIEFILMNQGENDVSRGTDATAYREGLSALAGYYQQDLGYGVPLIYCQLGPAMAGSWDAGRDPYMTAIRSAQATADNGVTLIMGASEMDLERNADNLHYTTDSQAVIGRRLANAIRYSLGDVDYYKGPEIIGARFTGPEQTIIEVAIRHYGGTGITPSSGITGFEVFVDGWAVEVVSARRKDAATIELTLESPVQGEATLRYLYGCLPDVSGLVKDNSPLQLPLCPTLSDITVQASGEEAGDVLYGDVDGSRAVTASDALLALQAATGKLTLNEQQADAADVDGIDGLTTMDALIILQYATGKLTAFPVER